MKSCVQPNSYQRWKENRSKTHSYSSKYTLWVYDIVKLRKIAAHQVIKIKIYQSKTLSAALSCVICQETWVRSTLCPVDAYGSIQKTSTQVDTKGWAFHIEMWKRNGCQLGWDQRLLILCSLCMCWQQAWHWGRL